MTVLPERSLLRTERSDEPGYKTLAVGVEAGTAEGGGEGCGAHYRAPRPGALYQNDCVLCIPPRAPRREAARYPRVERPGPRGVCWRGGEGVMSHCVATKRDGTPCTLSAQPGNEYCWAHDPANAEQRTK